MVRQGRAREAQAHALAIRARAEMRLAEEYDEAQERGDARGVGRPEKSNAGNSDLVTPDLIGGKNALQEARQFRDAERADPGDVVR